MTVTTAQLEALYLAYFGKAAEIEVLFPGAVPCFAFDGINVINFDALQIPVCATIMDKVFPVLVEPMNDQHKAHQRAVNVLGPRRGRWK